jgi:ribosome biogenesis GTPase / thiamine phosphate phosphatase
MMSSASLYTRLVGLGWSDERARAFAEHRAQGFIPGRVTSSSGITLATTQDGPVEVILQRRFKREAASKVDLPAVGDWLALEPLAGNSHQAGLRQVLPRRGTFLRSRDDDGKPQVLAANLDVAFLVSGLDHDLNPRRIERYLVLAMDAGVTPVVVLNKVDIALDLSRAVSDVHAIAAGTRVVVTSAIDGTGLDELRDHVGASHTACLLGSSGVGKSTIVNALLGEQRQSVQALREDDSRGRHTTTSRELFVLPGGGLLIDTPGLRAVGVLGEDGSVTATFEDIESLAHGCRFSDCRHETEPGCAIRAAIESDALTSERFASHQKLEAERRAVELRADERARRHADRQLGRFHKHALKSARRFKQLDD